MSELTIEQKVKMLLLPLAVNEATAGDFQKAAEHLLALINEERLDEVKLAIKYDAENSYNDSGITYYLKTRIQTLSQGGKK